MILNIILSILSIIIITLVFFKDTDKQQNVNLDLFKSKEQIMLDYGIIGSSLLLIILIVIF